MDQISKDHHRQIEPYECVSALGYLYVLQSRYGDAEPLMRQALQLSRKALGDRHPLTLQFLQNLASMFFQQGRLEEAEPLLRDALRWRREALGEDHPNTAQSLNALAVLSSSQGRHDEADKLLRQALALADKLLGRLHPVTTLYRTNYSIILLRRNMIKAAITQLQQVESSRQSWIASQFYSTQSVSVQTGLLNQQATFQDLAMTLAIRHEASPALQLAGDVMLRWKQPIGEEKAYIASRVQAETDASIRPLVDEINALRNRLAYLAHQDVPDQNPNELLNRLEARELELAQVSQIYKGHLEASRAGLADVQASIPSRSALIEFRQYQPVNITTGESGKFRWAAMLIRGADEVLLKDVGDLEETSEILATLLDGFGDIRVENAATTLHAQLIGPFADQLQEIDTVYVAPDGMLSLVPFERLRMTDGRYFGEAKELRFVQTGRDLVPLPEVAAPGRGLLALGGIDFDGLVIGEQPQAALAKPFNDFGTLSRSLRSIQHTTKDQIQAFKRLPGSYEEILLIANAFGKAFRDEPITLLSDLEATEAQLKAIGHDNVAVPRVLHLATHGFYLENVDNAVARPQLYSGISLAGANRALLGEVLEGEDGILYSIEAENLNLQGTRLVVLSACETGQGKIDYSEGVVGLVRALRIAGAQDILMTLWPVDDRQARDFMRTFYDFWLADRRAARPADSV